MSSEIKYAKMIVSTVVNNTDDKIASLYALRNLMLKKKGGLDIPRRAKNTVIAVIDAYLKKCVEETA